MKILIISSSQSENSRSFLLCENVAETLKNLGNEVELIDARKMELLPYGKGPTKDMEILKEKAESADAFIFGMAVYNYSVNDSLKIILDNALGTPENKFFGILCAAGGQRSYLSTMHLTQICMNEWRMIQLPRVVYATGQDFVDDEITNVDLKERLDLFSKEFNDIGNRLSK
jgi:NAD(P)H-dependent FMN reductase